MKTKSLTLATTHSSAAELPQLLALIPSEIADNEVDLYLDKLRRVTERSATFPELEEMVAEFGKALPKFQRDVDRAAFLRYVHLAIAEQCYTRPIVGQALHDLIGTEKWMPSIAEILPACKSLYEQAMRLIKLFEARLAAEQREAAAEVTWVDKQMRGSLSEAANRELESAEYRQRMFASRREDIAILQDKLAKLEQALERDPFKVGAILRQRYPDTAFLTAWREQVALQWHEQARQQVAELRAEIAEREAELRHLESSQCDPPAIEYTPSRRLITRPGRLLSNQTR